MQHEDIIYDAAILRMVAHLERFLRSNSGGEVSLMKAAEQWCKVHGAQKSVRQSMKRVVTVRNQIAHSPDRRMNYEDFSKFRRECARLDNQLGGKTGMRKVMTSWTLPYKMGNAGDVIKHGALAVFTEWYFKDNRAPFLTFADPFGGRPWGHPLHPEISARISRLLDTPLKHAQPQASAKHPRIFGSAHAVLNVAKKVGGANSARAEVSDRDRNARGDLETSGLHLIDEEGFDPNDGYSVLRLTDKFHLILIDPFSDFLRDEFSGGKNGVRFPKILEAIKNDLDLWIAVFVLNLYPDNHIGNAYAKYKKEHLADWAIGLHCPKTDMPEVDGKSHSDMLLISSQVKSAPDNVAKLRENLRKFAERASKEIGVKIGDAMKWPRT